MEKYLLSNKSGNYVDIASLDISKAFSIVSHGIFNFL